MIAATASNRVIGKDGQIPWHIPEDLALFKETTMGHPLIMGRLTFESFPEPLPGREHIVLTRQSGLSHQSDRVTYVQTADEALDVAQSIEDEVAYVIGGQTIYELFLDQADELILSEIPGTYDGDTYFPEIDSSNWTVEKIEPHEDFTRKWYRK